MLRGLLRVLSKVPLRWMHAWGAALGWIIYSCSSGYARRMKNNLRNSGLGGDRDSYRRLLRAAVAQNGKALTELPAVWFRDDAAAAGLIVECEGWEVIETVRRRGQSIIFLSPHMGCFEIAARYVASHFPLTVMYRPPREPWLDALMESGRSNKQMHLAPTSIKGVRMLYRALRRGESVGLLPDHAPGIGEGVWANFFGQRAFTMTLPRKLQRASGAAFIMTFGERLPCGKGFRLHFEKLSTREFDEEKLNRAIEAIVRRYPDQYYWNYNRYKKMSSRRRRGTYQSRRAKLIAAPRAVACKGRRLARLIDSEKPGVLMPICDGQRSGTILPQNTSDPADKQQSLLSRNYIYVSDWLGPRLSVVEPSGKYLYVANWDLGGISAYAIERASGRLRRIPASPFPTGRHPRALTVDPQGRFIYAANWDERSVSGFHIDQATGNLAAMPASPFRTGLRPRNVRLHPSGRLAFVSNRDSNSISVFTVDGKSGALAPAAGGQVPAGQRTRYTVIDPTARFAYAAHQGADTISAYSIDAMTGDLQPVPDAPVRVGNDPRSINIDPSGRFLYVTNRGSNDLSLFAIDARDGRLVPRGAARWPVGRRPFAFTIHPSGRFAYVTNLRSNSISGFTIDGGDGAITEMAGSPFGAGSYPVWPIFHPSGNFLYVNNYRSGDISAYAVDGASGVLSAVRGSPFVCGSRFLPGTHPREPIIDPSGKNLFVVNREADTVSAFAIDAGTGGLVSAMGSPFAPHGFIRPGYFAVVAVMLLKSLRRRRG